MAIAATVARKLSLRQESCRSDRSNGAIVAVSSLPDMKEWIADYDLLVLMLDGWVNSKIELFTLCCRWPEPLVL